MSLQYMSGDIGEITLNSAVLPQGKICLTVPLNYISL